jgi:hypothetical protein
MRDLTRLEPYRIRGREIMQLWGWEGDETCGAFQIRSPIDQAPMKVIASSGEGWDHVSVSRVNRCPNWPEMEYIKRLFFRDDETAMQLHVPPNQHVNMMSTCLHIWRPHNVEIPRPPSNFVGVGSAPARNLAEAKALMKVAQK